MRLILTLTLAITLLSATGHGQSKPTHQFVFPQVGWKVKVPTDFTIMDSAQAPGMTIAGYDTTTKYGKTKTLISFSKGQYNFFSSTVTPFDPARDGDWKVANSKLKNEVLATLGSQSAAIKIDTSSSVETIDGVEFQKFQIITTYQSNLVMNTSMYSRLYKGLNYGINISYTDENIGKELQLILASSTFDK